MRSLRATNAVSDWWEFMERGRELGMSLETGTLSVEFDRKSSTRRQ
jgi:hypothetical protein